MAHHVDKTTSALADKVGPFSAIFMMGGFIAAMWVLVRKPMTAARCIAAALVFAGVSSNPTQHPLLGLGAILVGFYLATPTPKKGN